MAHMDGDKPNMACDLGLAGPPSGHRVVVAMSGGVDSSAAAALVAASGYQTIGITLQLYSSSGPRRPGACCAGDDIRDAGEVAARMGFAHYVLDYEERFRQAVIEDFADSYRAGLTPIPCVRCNQRVKFADLLSVARDLGASALVTGHYVRRIMGRDGAELHCAQDRARDQSYFLFQTTREQLEFLRFPLGDMAKPETRELAHSFGLQTADKKDSQDICFVPDGRYARLVEQVRPGAAEPGEIVDSTGRVLGRHNGIIHYTIGQRRGLNLDMPDPRFVLRLEPETRRVVVGPREELGAQRISVGEWNWLEPGSPEPGREVLVKVRSTRPPVSGHILEMSDGTLGIELAQPEEAVAPGQGCVCYAPENDGTKVLGGGFIRRSDIHVPGG